MDEWWPIVVALPFVVALMLSGVWASNRFASFDKLPSHFDLRGKADRFAPRGVMVWMLPVLFSLMLVGTAAAFLLVPQHMQNGDQVPGVIFSGCVLVAAQVFVLWLTVRWAQGEG